MEIGSRSIIFFPEAEGGNGDHLGKSNIIRIPYRFHDGWHILFGNMTVPETIEFIQIIFEGKGKKRIKKTWSHEDIYNLQLKLQKETMLGKKRYEREDNF